MRQPQRWRNIGLGFFLSGIVATPLPFLVREGAVNDPVLGSLFIYGLMALLFGGMIARMRHTEARAWESLRRGEEIIARWHVDGATWRAFLALNDRVNDGNPRKNELTLYLRKTPPAEGVNVIVSRTGVEIDGDFHHLPRRFGWALAVCGLIVTGLMVPVLYYTVPLLLQPGVDTGGMRFSGSEQQAQLVLGVLGAVFVFGVTALAYGIWQIRTGQRNEKVIFFIVGLAAAMYFTATLV
jgi:hypothetical protein